MPLHGRAMAIAVGPTPTAVGSVTDWKRASSTGKDDVTACGDTAKSFLTGLPDDSGSISCFWDGADDGQEDLEEAYRAGTAIDIHVYPTGETTELEDYEFFGSVMIDSLSTSGSVNSAFSCEFTYAGALLYRIIPDSTP